MTESSAAFWAWFVEHATDLAHADPSEETIDELERKLAAVEQLDWELGPGKNTAHMFAVSPRGDRRLLAVTRQLVSRAPILEGWEFYPAKPVRDWQLEFALRIDDRNIDIDGKDWEFVSYRYSDGVCDVLLKPRHDLGLSKKNLYWAAVIICDGELGEEKRLDRVNEIEVVSTWEAKAARSARRLEPGLLRRVIGASADKRH